MRLLNRNIIFSIMMFFCLGSFGARAAVDPVVVEVHYQNGVKFYKRGLYKKAVRELENTLSLDPENREAKEYLQKAIELSSSNLWANAELEDMGK